MDLSKYPVNKEVGHHGEIVVMRNALANNSLCDCIPCKGNSVIEVSHAPYYRYGKMAPQICGDCLEDLINALPLEMILLREDMKGSAATIKRLVSGELETCPDGTLKDLAGARLRVDYLNMTELKATAEAFGIDKVNSKKKEEVVKILQKYFGNKYVSTGDPVPIETLDEPVLQELCNNFRVVFHGKPIKSDMVKALKIEFQNRNGKGKRDPVVVKLDNLFPEPKQEDEIDAEVV